MVTIRQATDADNAKLLRLTATSGMAGDIGLRIDRNPDFFALLKLRGETKVFVAEENEQIIGCICVSRQDVYVGGDIFPVQYVGDFKVAEQYRNQGIGLRLCNEMADYVISQDSDLAFLNVSKGNNKPLSFFKDRPNVPDFVNIGTFRIYQIIGKKMRTRNSAHEIEEVTPCEEVIEFFNRHQMAYQLGPVLSSQNFLFTRIFAVRDKGNIVAAMSLIDTMPVKQNVVTGLSWKLKFLLRIINAISNVAGFSQMPVLNDPVKMLYIRHLAVDSSSKQLLRRLLNHARDVAFEKSYSYVSIGLHEKDKLNDCLGGFPKLTFKSVGMLLSIKDNRDLIRKVKEGIPYEDYSLV